MGDAHLITLFATLRTGICLFCASTLLTRRTDKELFLPLGLMFFCQGLTEIPVLLSSVPAIANQFVLFHYANLALIMPDLISPFLLWWYVWELTREDADQTIPKKWRHISPLAFAFLLNALAFFIPPNLLQAEVDFPGALPLQIIIGIVALVALYLLMTGLVATYLALIIRRLKRHQRRLKDIFASTEDRELRWIWLIVLWSVLYVLFNVADLVIMFYDEAISSQQAAWLEMSEEITLLGLIWVIGLWGLRQRPAFAPAPAFQKQPESRQPKYENSALGDEQASRIALKIKSAMQDDLLYRDPNLSLFNLSKHIGASSHYVSQTLNSKLHATFFDYINSWRIKDALNQLTTTDKTVLMITLDVGFNSRSSFYKAFKRETGKTPMQFKR